MKSRGSRPDSTEMLRKARSMWESTMRTTPSAKCSGLCRMLLVRSRKVRGAVIIKLHDAAEKGVGFETAEHEIGIGDGGFEAATEADRSRACASGFGPYFESAATVEASQGTATRAYGVNTEHGNGDRHAENFRFSGGAEFFAID